MLRLLARFFRKLQPKPDQSATIAYLQDALDDATARDRQYRQAYIERAAELVEARQMAGAGPWLVHEARASINTPGKLREADPIVSQGAYGDIELALQNVEWRREINLSWLEFSRWGIQQIILICRLYYIKNPIVRRLINVSASYVFGRGVEVSSPDEAANEVLQDFFAANQETLGQIALAELEARKAYDGNLFFCFFADSVDTGTVKIRTIDATEIQDIVCNPDDVDEPWFYRRRWTQRMFNEQNGQLSTQSMERWYPALNYTPDERIAQINGAEVAWDTPVYHRKCGHVSKWHFGCPTIYPALDWAKESKKFLESCASVRHALAQIAMTLSTKGGQQAIEGAKQQLQTSVGPSSALWDTNPAAVNGAIFASGTGTTLAAFNTRGAGADPEEVRQFKLMCCMVMDVPETFLADVSTGNLATATTLDRPTELAFLLRQEAWRADLVTIAKYVLSVSKGAPGGRLRESHKGNLRIIETPRTMGPHGRMVYVSAADRKPEPNTIEVQANFPAIREGDIPALVGAVVQAMTLGNKGGQVIGIDEKEGVKKLYDLVGIERGDEISEDQYPEGEYDPDRTKEPLPAPIPRAQPAPGGEPQVTPAMERAFRRLGTALKIWEASGERNGHTEHSHTR